MKKEHLHNNTETFLAKWLEGELTDGELKNLVSNEDYVTYLKLRKALQVNEQLNASVDDSFENIKARIAPKKTKVRTLYTYWNRRINCGFIWTVYFFGFQCD